MTEADNTSRLRTEKDGVPLEISHDEMSAAHQSGAATPLSTFITDIVAYNGHWWIAYTSTWLLITDEPTITRLERHAEWANPQVLRDPFGT